MRKIKNEQQIISLCYYLKIKLYFNNKYICFCSYSADTVFLFNYVFLKKEDYYLFKIEEIPKLIKIAKSYNRVIKKYEDNIKKKNIKKQIKQLIKLLKIIFNDKKDILYEEKRKE